jgi:hypothetical protein
MALCKVVAFVLLFASGAFAAFAWDDWQCMVSDPFPHIGLSLLTAACAFAFFHVAGVL